MFDDQVGCERVNVSSGTGLYKRPLNGCCCCCNCHSILSAEFDSKFRREAP